LHSIIEDVGTFASELTRIAEVVVPPLATVLEELIPVVSDLSDEFSDFIKQRNSAIDTLISEFNTLRNESTTTGTVIDETLNAIDGAFDSVVEAIKDSLGRLNFVPLVGQINAISSAVQALIDGLNELSGVDIDVDIPTVDDIVSGGGSDSDGSDESQGPDAGRDGDRTSGGSPDAGRDGDRTSGGEEDDDDPIAGPSPDPDPVPVTPTPSPRTPDPEPPEPDPPSSGGTGPGLISPDPTRLSTGGLIEEAGAAILHSGERVVPAAQVRDRGGASSGVQIDNLTVNADTRQGGREAGKALKRELKRFDI
jgi:hypothetical protein